MMSETKEDEQKEGQRIQASFGVITDLHYADHDDGFDFTKNHKRYFRDSLVHLERAVNHWNRCPGMKFAIQIGDIIDGRNNKKEGESKAALDKVLNLCAGLSDTKGERLPFMHVIGNHDLYNFTRNAYQNSRLNCHTKNNLTDFDYPDPDRNYYSFSISKDYRIVVLDNYDISVLGIDDEACSQYKQAREYMKNNPNVDNNSHHGLFGLDERFTAYNGAFSEAQLSWFRRTLISADNNHHKLIVFGHTPLYANSSVKSCLAWNYEAMLNAMHSNKVVKVYICGHDHRGGEATDSHGIYHLTLKGTVETCLQKGHSYLTVNLYEHHIEILHDGQPIIVKNSGD